MKRRSRLRLAWRIGLAHYETDEAFDTLLADLMRRRDIVDEVALFDSNTHHLYIPLEDYARRAELMAPRLAAFRGAGVRSAGINVLATIGHINEAWSYMPALPFQPMVGHDGSVSTGCACPNTSEMRDYVRAKYRLVAGAGPDFVWVDDDIRMHHHGDGKTVLWGCFCPTCLGMFARSSGQSFTREGLVAALNDPAGDQVRRLWVAQNIESIESLLKDVEQAVHQVNPAIVTGLMTAGAAWTTYSGMAFDRWFAALKAGKARPGGGFYSDEIPIQMCHKALDVGWQRSALPATVTDCQYELENFPYQALKKSPASAVNECTLALASGLNGVAFNVLGLTTEDYQPILERAARARGVWEALVAHADGLPTVGLWPAWSTSLMAKRSVRPREDWFRRDRNYDITASRVLGEIGLPLATDYPGCGVVLAGRIAEAFEDDQLREMLAGGVLMDSTALEVLHERGMGDLCGVRIAARTDNGMMERLTDDPLNGPARGRLRDARIEFWGDAHGMADALEPAADGVRVLAEMEDYFGRRGGPCMTAYENRLGGRIVVAGYAQWIFVHSAAKRTQLQNVADWISRGRMPVRIEPTVPLVAMVRHRPRGRRAAVVLLNRGLEVVKEATIHLRLPVGSVRLLRAGQPARSLRPRRERGGSSVSVRNMAPWSVWVLLVGQSGVAAT